MPHKKPKVTAKPATTSFGQIGGALPPAPTAAELKAERARLKDAGSLYVPGTMKAKPAKPKPKRGGILGNITGVKTRRRMLDETMGR